MDQGFGAPDLDESPEVVKFLSSFFLCFMASEVGEADIPPAHLLQWGAEWDVGHG